jgi:hypothetical protein
MTPRLRHRRRARGADDTATDTSTFVSDESAVLRNYDGARSHTVAVRLVDPDGNTALERSYVLDPQGVLTVSARLERTVYRVEATVDDDLTASAECLVGSGPDETVLVETGNGAVDVSEGVV